MGETKRKFLPLYSYYDRTGIQRHLEGVAQNAIKTIGRNIKNSIELKSIFFPSPSSYIKETHSNYITFVALCQQLSSGIYWHRSLFSYHPYILMHLI